MFLLLLLFLKALLLILLFSHMIEEAPNSQCNLGKPPWIGCLQARLFNPSFLISHSPFDFSSFSNTIFREMGMLAFPPAGTSTNILTVGEITGPFFLSSVAAGRKVFRVWSGVFNEALFLGLLTDRGRVSLYCQHAGFLPVTINGSLLFSKSNQLGIEKIFPSSMMSNLRSPRIISGETDPMSINCNRYATRHIENCDYGPLLP